MASIHGTRDGMGGIRKALDAARDKQLPTTITYLKRSMHGHEEVTYVGIPGDITFAFGQVRITIQTAEGNHSLVESNIIEVVA